MALRLLLSLADFSFLKESDLGDYLNQIGLWLVFGTFSLLLIDVGGPPPGHMFLACRSKEDEQASFSASFFFCCFDSCLSCPEFPQWRTVTWKWKVQKPFFRPQVAFGQCFVTVTENKLDLCLLNCLRMWLSGWSLDWCAQGSGLWSQAPGAGVQHIDVRNFLCKVYSNSYSITFF